MVVAVPGGLGARLANAAPGPVEQGAFVTDAISRLQAMLAVGAEVEVPHAGGPMDLLDVRVPWWAADQLDRAIGTQPGLDDRSAALAAAVSAHLDALGGGRPPASVREMRTPVAARAGDAPRESPGGGTANPLGSWAVRAERAERRLMSLVGADSYGMLDLEALLPPGIPADAELSPSSVIAGLTNQDLREVTFADPTEADRQGSVRLTGLTNRVAPTLWATAQLAVMQAQVGGREVRYHDFLRDVMPRAWQIGEGLAASTGSSPRRGFMASARWPKVLARPSRKYADADDERAGRALSLAQAATNFIEYSLIASPLSSRGAGRPVGPMAALGLAGIWRDDDGLWVAVNREAVPLLLDLGELGTSCDYPHSYDAWRAYQDYLMAHARCEEAKDQLTVLDILATSKSRTEFYERVSAVKMTKRQREREQDRASEGKSTKGYSTEANGFIGRLREWGLVSMEEGVFGPQALTSAGQEALDTFGPEILRDRD